MAVSDEIKDATKKAKKGAAEQKGQFKHAAHNAEALAKESGSEVRERISYGRHHAPKGKS